MKWALILFLLTPKPVWLWTDAERLAARFAPGSAEKRAAASPDQRMGHDGPQREIPNLDFVDGRKNPELLLPFELFREMVKLRPYYEESLKRAGFKEAVDRHVSDFPRLTEERRTTIEGLLERRPRTGPDVQAADAEVRLVNERHSIAQCRYVADAFVMVQKDLGPDRSKDFLRFLFDNVAPSILNDGPNTETNIRRLAGGCR